MLAVATVAWLQNAGQRAEEEGTMMRASIALSFGTLLLSTMVCAPPTSGRHAAVPLDEVFFVTQGHHPDLGGALEGGPGCNRSPYFAWETLRRSSG